MKKPKLYSTKYILFPENKLAPDKMLYLVGLGLYDEKDVTLRGHEIIKKCDKVYLEAYTSILMISKARLEEFYGKKIIEADRDMVELQAEDILESAKNQDVALLVVGDPFSATTHSDIVLRAFSLGIKVQSVHNASILTAIGDTGLFLYNFGPTISIPFFTDNWKPASFYHKLKENMDKKYHTLCLLDIKVKEQSEENLSKGKKIYEPPRFMSVSTAVSQLLFLEDQEKLGLVSLESKAIAVARLGSPDQKIVYGTFKELLNFDMGSPLHSLIVPGELHEIELEMLSYFRINN